MKIINRWFSAMFFLLAIASVFLIVFYFQNKKRQQGIEENKPVSVDYFQAENQKESAPGADSEEAETNEQLPSKFLLDVPFQPQAPYADWSQPYQDACEEAAIIIVKHYLENKALSKAEMKSEIDAAVRWQLDNWGGHFDLDANKTLQLAKEYFGLSGKVIKNYQLDELKRYLTSGLPIVAPTAGRMLGNPNFTGAGPEYHMLVIIGYNDEAGLFITNDPGTRKGKSYVYKYSVLFNAVSGPHSNMAKELVLLYL